jgi:serine/threonine protein kinase
MSNIRRNLPKHPNLIEYFGVIHHPSAGFGLVMKLMARTLSSALQDQNLPLNIQHKLECCKQIALGLEYLHANNVIHRDLAARNCLVTNACFVTIADGI